MFALDWLYASLVTCLPRMVRCLQGLVVPQMHSDGHKTEIWRPRPHLSRPRPRSCVRDEDRNRWYKSSCMAVGSGSRWPSWFFRDSSSWDILSQNPKYCLRDAKVSRFSSSPLLFLSLSSLPIPCPITAPLPSHSMLLTSSWVHCLWIYLWTKQDCSGMVRLQKGQGRREISDKSRRVKRVHVVYLRSTTGKCNLDMTQMHMAAHITCVSRYFHRVVTSSVGWHVSGNLSAAERSVAQRAGASSAGIGTVCDPLWRRRLIICELNVIFEFIGRVVNKAKVRTKDLTLEAKVRIKDLTLGAKAKDLAFKAKVRTKNWIGLSSILRPRQHSIGYMGDGFYRSKDPTNSIKVL